MHPPVALVPPPRRAHAPPAACLLVDAGRVDRRHARGVAAAAGLPVVLTEAATLAAAREAMSSEAFDLLIVASRLPDGEGIELARAVAASTIWRGTPVLVLTVDRRDDAALDAVPREIAARLARDGLTPGRFRRAVKQAIARRRLARCGAPAAAAAGELCRMLDRLDRDCIAALRGPMAQMLRTVRLLADTSGLPPSDRDRAETLLRACRSLWGRLEDAGVAPAR